MADGFEGNGELATSTERDLCLRGGPNWREEVPIRHLARGEVMIVLDVCHDFAEHTVHGNTSPPPFLKVLTSLGLGWVYAGCIALLPVDAPKKPSRGALDE